MAVANADAAATSNACKCLWDGQNSEGDTLTLNSVENLSLNLLCCSGLFVVFFFHILVVNQCNVCTDNL